MRWRTAIILALPVVLGIAGLVARTPRPRPASPATRAAPAAAPVAAPEAMVEMPADNESEKEVARKIRRTWREMSVEEFDLRIQQLIASIDWTRAESRIRFPVEYDLIREEFERAFARFRDPE